MNITVKAETFLREYVQIQERLCKALIEHHPIGDTELLTDLPRHGLLPVEDVLWEFQKHGRGVRFLEVISKNVIDVPIGVASFPRGIDAWRLIEHMEHQQLHLLEYKKRTYDASSEVQINQLLNILLVDGVLKVENGLFNFI